MSLLISPGAFIEVVILPDFSQIWATLLHDCLPTPTSLPLTVELIVHIAGFVVPPSLKHSALLQYEDNLLVPIFFKLHTN